VLLVAGAVLGLIAGLLTGGSLRRLAGLQLTWWLLPVLIAALAVKELGARGPLAGHQDVITALFPLSLLALVGWTLWHVGSLPGIWLVTLGLVLNLVVVVANGGHMPVAPEFAGHGPGQLVETGRMGQYILEGPQTRLPWLDDRIQLPGRLWTFFPQIYSAGDLVSLAGIFLVLFLATHRGERRSVRAAR
jgi:Family of unknown function (DUF5317)